MGASVATMFTKQVSRQVDGLDRHRGPPRPSRPSEPEESPGHGPDRGSCALQVLQLGIVVLIVAKLGFVLLIGVTAGIHLPRTRA